MTQPSIDDRDGPLYLSRASGRSYTDLGFGRVVAQQVRGRFLTHDGEPTSRKYGLGAQRIERFYLRALAAPLPVFLAWGLGVLLLLNGFFALAYLALGDGALRGGEASGVADPFLRAFSFSVGIFTTTGTAPMYAVGATAHWLVVLESFFGPFVLVATAGLLIARLTRPRMRLRFSESAVVAPYEGGRGLMFRIVNVQPGELSDVQVRLSVTLLEEVEGTPGRRERNFYPLALERCFGGPLHAALDGRPPDHGGQPAARARRRTRFATLRRSSSCSSTRTRRPSRPASRRARRTGGTRSAGTRSSPASSPARRKRCSRSTSSGSIGWSASSPARRARRRRASCLLTRDSATESQ